MLFSNFVATIKADLGAIREDLGEFVETVKTDTTAILGLDNGVSGPHANSGSSKHVPQWEEDLWENPDLLCEDPLNAEEWSAVASAKDEDVEALLQGDVVSELYRELVPSKTTHADFFKRLIFHKNRLQLIVKNRMDELTGEGGNRAGDDEEETRWEDDSVGSVAEKQPQEEEEQRRQKDGDEFEALKLELTQMAKHVQELELKLRTSEEARMELEAKLASALDDQQQQPREPVHKKVPPMMLEKLPVVEATSTSTTTSWEALPSSNSPVASSNEEPVVVMGTSPKAASAVVAQEEEEEEDDWE